MAKKEETQDPTPEVEEDLPRFHPRSKRFDNLPAPGKSRTRNGNVREDH